MDDRKLIKKIKQKDEKALEVLIDKYGWVVKTVVYKHLYNFKNVQEECINDIFLGIWNNIDSYNPDKASLKNWIGSISKYKSIDYLRKYAKDLEQQDIENLNISSEIDEYKEIIEEGISEELEKLISPLKERDKIIFRKLFYEEKSIDEISTEEGVSSDVLYNRISRGKKKIKKNLASKEVK